MTKTKYSDPKFAPPPRTTATGRPMTTRSARLHDWLAANGCGMSTMATDETVRAMLPRLQALRAELVAGLSPSSDDWRHAVVRDLDAIIRRVPDNRCASGRSIGAASAGANAADAGVAGLAGALGAPVPCHPEEDVGAPCPAGSHGEEEDDATARRFALIELD